MKNLNHQHELNPNNGKLHRIYHEHSRNNQFRKPTVSNHKILYTSEQNTVSKNGTTIGYRFVVSVRALLVHPLTRW